MYKIGEFIGYYGTSILIGTAVLSALCALIYYGGWFIGWMFGLTEVSPRTSDQMPQPLVRLHTARSQASTSPPES